MNGRPRLRRAILILASVAAFAAILLVTSAGVFGASQSAIVAPQLGLLLVSEGARVALLIFLLFFPGWFVLDAVRGWAFLKTTTGATAVLSLPASALLLCALLVVLQVSGAPNDVFLLVVLLLYVPALAVTVLDPRRRARAVGWLQTYRYFLLLPALVSLCAICYLGVGLEDFSQVTDCRRAVHRALHEVPEDNDLSWRASLTWRAHAPVTVYFAEVWQIGERGPLYAALHSFLYRALEPDAPTYAGYVRLGIVLNSLFLGPLLLWISALVGRRVGWLCTALVGLNPWFFFNVYYTWPKLLETYFLIAALYLLWRRPAPSSLTSFAVGGTLGGLTGLAHPGGLLSLPVLYAVTVVRSLSTRRVLLRSLAMPIMASVVMSPWLLYKSWYSPEHYGLFALHFLDDKNALPVGQNIARYFREHGEAEQIAMRERNVQFLWWADVDFRLIVDFWRGRAVGKALYVKEFFVPWYSAGLTWFAWVVVGIPVALVGRALRPPSQRPAARKSNRLAVLIGLEKSRDWSAWPVVAFVAISLTFLAALRSRGPFSHEMPYTEVVMLAALLLVCLARLGPIYLLLATIAVVSRQVFYFQESARTSSLHLPAIDPFGVLFWLVVAATLAVTIVVGRDRPMDVT